MEHFDGEFCHFLQIGEYLTIAQCQTVEDATANFCVSLWYRLSVILAIGLYGFYHGRGVGKHLVVGIDEALEGLALHGLALQLRM